jgi:hypothetical protein
MRDAGTNVPHLTWILLLLLQLEDKLRQGIESYDELAERLRWTVALLPEILVQPPCPLSEPRRVTIRERPRDRDQHRPVEKGFAIVGLDGRAALVARPPRSAADGIGPAWTEAAAEVAPHERMFA